MLIKRIPMNKKSRSVVNYRIRIKQKLIEYKGGKCQKCGYNKPVPGVYHFHHRDPKTKLFWVNGSTLGYEKQRVEVDKCDLLCANCHAEEHDLEWRETRKQAFICRRKKLVEIKCKQCNNLFLPKRKEQIYCGRKCQHLSMLIPG